MFYTAETREVVQFTPGVTLPSFVVSHKIYLLKNSGSYTFK